MANDIVFKTKTFGGFDKEQVMDFVNKILSEKKELEKRIAESNLKVAEANAQINEYKAAAEELETVKQTLNEAEEKLVSLEEEISCKETKINELTEANEKLSANAVSEDVLNELETLRADNTRLRMENEKKKDLERQVGAAMLDARVHSESLVEDAKEKANAVTKAVYNAIGETALKIDDLSGGIGEIARNFQKSVEEVELRIKALTGDMSKTAQLLISENAEVTETKQEIPAVEYDFTPKSNGEVNINSNDFQINKPVDLSGGDYTEE